MSALPVYLDYNSTAPVDERVLDAMLPFFRKQFGNAASRTHAYGWAAAKAVDIARAQVAHLLGAEENEIIFTSGSTEAINLAIKGACAAYATKGKHILVSATEHKAVLDTCSFLERAGAEITRIPVDREGIIDLDFLKKNIRRDTILVCVMTANNETGTIQPVDEIAAIVHEAGSVFFSDTTQALGKMNVHVNEAGIDLCCISAHKICGPKGAGALFVRRKDPRVSLVAQMHGGGHERGLRSGTLNVPGIVGLGKAAEIAAAEGWDDAQRLSVLRTELEQKIISCGTVFVNGSVKDRLPNTTNLRITGVKAAELIAKLPLLAFSAGSACTSAIPEPSHVLKAMGLSGEESHASIRLSIGKFTTDEEIAKAGELLCNQINALRYS
ncbi:MAG TPA: aminotransferase class V-fold PLP-dependent enzyme [Bacteroidia bacterium]|nr:aminotransferase class V-fold PLP-dependent enzyme [Bacteroidia bacterium]